MKSQSFLFSALLVLLSYSSLAMEMDKMAMSDIDAHWFINGEPAKKMTMIKPGVPTAIEVFFTKKEMKNEKLTEVVLKDFKRLHGKIMHMVLVKKDLSVFKHVHPYFDPVTGRFQIVLNLKLNDPDNFQTQNAAVEPGMYMLMADIEPKKIGMRMLHTHLHVMGESDPKDLIKDATFNSPEVGTLIAKDYYPKGTEKSPFPPYKIEAQIQQTLGCDGELIDIGLNLKRFNKNGTYSKEDKVERWLRSGAHLVWFSQEMMNDKGEMAMLHTHSRPPNKEFSLNNPDLYDFKFSYYNQGKLTPGVQKIWVQIKVSGKVHTIPLVFDYYPSTLTPAHCK